MLPHLWNCTSSHFGHSTYPPKIGDKKEAIATNIDLDLGKNRVVTLGNLVYCDDSTRLNHLLSNMWRFSLLVTLFCESWLCKATLGGYPSRKRICLNRLTTEILYKQSQIYPPPTDGKEHRYYDICGFLSVCGVNHLSVPVLADG